ncbi:RRM3, partial [Symbiodinium pilosum]
SNRKLPSGCSALLKKAEARIRQAAAKTAAGPRKRPAAAEPAKASKAARTDSVKFPILWDKLLETVLLDISNEA